MFPEITNKTAFFVNFIPVLPCDFQLIRPRKAVRNSELEQPVFSLLVSFNYAALQRASVWEFHIQLQLVAWSVTQEYRCRRSGISDFRNESLKNIIWVHQEQINKIKRNNPRGHKMLDKNNHLYFIIYIILFIYIHRRLFWYLRDLRAFSCFNFFVFCFFYYSKNGSNNQQNIIFGFDQYFSQFNATNMFFF